MDNEPIKFLLIGDISTGKKITEFSTKINKKKDEIDKIFTKICKTSAGKYEERNKITSKTENYYFITLKPGIVFLALVSNTYPERLVFELIDKINQEKIPTMINEETKELNAKGRQDLKTIIDSYQNNVINEISKDINDIKLDMKDNIKKMVESIDDTSILEQSAENLRQESKNYRENANELKKLTFCQNFKMWFALGGIVVLLILLFYFIFKP
jgi:hypothetical protein